ncbi:MAG: YdcH family protein [Rhodobacteraceae bacterium]|nr:YdcH family protein [Paracoccaceae bacterium]
MSVASRIQELRRKHDTLSRRVEDAQRNPSSSTIEIVEMKKQKLRLKEEIERLSHA